MPIMDYFGLPATARASFGCYNDSSDVERLVSAVHKVRELFA
jgi:cysteine desulfurase/selenocysteine lyase